MPEPNSNLQDHRIIESLRVEKSSESLKVEKSSKILLQESNHDPVFLRATLQPISKDFPNPGLLFSMAMLTNIEQLTVTA